MPAWLAAASILATVLDGAPPPDVQPVPPPIQAPAHEQAPPVGGAF